MFVPPTPSMGFGFTPTEVRAEYLNAAAVHRDAGRLEQAARMEAEAAFRDLFPVELGWAPDSTVDLAGGVLQVAGTLYRPSGGAGAGAGPASPSPDGAAAPVVTGGRLPWWIWPAAGAVVLALMLAVGRRKAA